MSSILLPSDNHKQHVGVRRYSTFLRQVHDMLDDDGIFVLQVAGFRPSWQYEDLIWQAPLRFCCEKILTVILGVFS